MQEKEKGNEVKDSSDRYFSKILDFFWVWRSHLHTALIRKLSLFTGPKDGCLCLLHHGTIPQKTPKQELISE
ncbi:hypothetical protein HY213_03395 [Candidatus Peregrinibacteria bacterium]|nr:hypothetical protein [Candidatus Peregrinibacteria bacterium]